MTSGKPRQLVLGANLAKASKGKIAFKGNPFVCYLIWTLGM
jgi:hypothetical protein